jgi:hypothetical protein
VCGCVRFCVCVFVCVFVCVCVYLCVCQIQVQALKKRDTEPILPCFISI